MFWLCALSSALSKSVLLVEENSAFHRAQSHASIRCPCRPSWACFFLFLPIPQFFSATSLSGGEISFLSPGGLAAAPGFTHNWFTRLQRGREPVPLVSFPYPVPKTAQRAAQGRVLVFSPERAYPSPFRGRGEGSPVWFAGFFTQRSPVLFRRKRRILRIR